jgi:hypothetical protein
MLAEIAAIRTVITIAFFLQRIYLAEDVPDPAFLAERYCFIYFPLRDRRICAGHGDQPLSQDFMCYGSEKRGIHTPGKTYCKGTQTGNVFFQLFELLIKFFG